MSRYPKANAGVGVPESFLSDLDKAFTKLISLVPSQHNTSLKRILSGKRPAQLGALSRSNSYLRALRRHLNVVAT